jgi:hypothetical protein
MEEPSTTYQELLQVQIERCSGDPYLLGRLRSFLTTLLPSHLDRARESRDRSAVRRDRFEREAASFTQEFLIRNRYTFASPSDTFFSYDGSNLIPRGEDDVLHDVLTALSCRRDLTPWKHKLKASVMKKIKERHPFSTIPESATIQRAIDAVWHPFFPSRDATKYFMAAAGDCLLGTAGNRVYIVHPHLKPLLADMMHHAYTLFGISSTAFQPIKLKYHAAHPVENVRLVRSADLERAPPLASSARESMADILYVCAHYSERYNGSDGFLGANGNDRLAEHALFLRGRSLSDIASEFADSELQVSSESRMSKKDMRFALRGFFESRQIPPVVSYDAWHDILAGTLPYDAESGEFTGVTSPSLPLVASFRAFWDKYIVPDDESELEIGEIVTLFTRSGGRTGRGTADPSTVLMEIVRHFYPSVVFEDGKHAIGVRCTEWDKAAEVWKAVDSFRTRRAAEGAELPTSVDAMYDDYSRNAGDRVVGKRFFEKIAADILGDSVDDSGCVHTAWWTD